MEERNWQRNASGGSSQNKSYMFSDMLEELSDLSDTPSNSNPRTGSSAVWGAKPKSNYYTNGAARGNNGYRKGDSSYPKHVAKTSKNTVISESQNLKQNIYSSVNAFSKSKNNFSNVYVRWSHARRLTIEELRTLVGDLHEEQLQRNKAQKSFREIGYYSRSMKGTSSPIDTFAGVFAFLSDAASGITSIVEAINMEKYSEKFKEIMGNDAEITKELYEARSQCVLGYKGIEEITRKYPSSTFNSTVSKISNELSWKHIWKDICNAYENDDTSSMLSVIGSFVADGSQLAMLKKIGDAIVTYTDLNPAAVDACNSVVRAAFGVYDLAYTDEEKSKTMSRVSKVSNRLMILDDRKQIERLNCMIHDDTSQSKLEDKIQDTILNLEFEMKRIVDAYNQ